MSEQIDSKIEFLQFHRPPLLDGEYRLTVNEHVTVEEHVLLTDAKRELNFTAERSFTITGERFRLTPQHILSVYPPPGSTGDHENVLPHVVLGRSTLPWERKAQSDQADHEAWPWLAVLLFDEDEAPKPQVISLNTLLDGGEDVTFPDLEREPTDHDDDRVTVIDVPADLLQQIAPTGPELALLAHVRQPQTANGQNQSGERPVIMGNRLPRRGRTSVAHLVSVEDHYQDGRLAAPQGKLVRLVSLKSWRFSCLDEASYMVTESLLRPKDGDPFGDSIVNGLRHLVHQEIVGQVAFEDKLRMHLGDALTDELLQQLLQDARHQRLTFKGLLLGLDRDLLRLPPEILSADAVAGVPEIGEAQRRRDQGHSPLSHHLRDGQKTLSWYHGPLATGPTQTSLRIQLPAPAADALLQHDERSGLYDVSYAAAWELGRLLALQDTPFALSLYHWKRAHARQLKDAETQLSHLPFSREQALPEMPDDVAHWLYQLSLLRRVPFNYLVPDRRMLPTESIRFFEVDQDWTRCLLDGAFSVGRVLDSDFAHEKKSLVGEETPLRVQAVHRDSGEPAGTLSGFLLRSDLVPGWPHLQVDGYPERHPTMDVEAPGERLPLLRMERLADDVLLCLFQGRVQTVGVHQKPEGLHSGVSLPDQRHPGYYKRRRDPSSGEELPDCSGPNVIVPVPFRPEAKNGTPEPADLDDPPPHRVLDVAALAQMLHAPDHDEDPTAAGFALQMVEGVARVRFVLAPLT